MTPRVHLREITDDNVAEVRRVRVRRRQRMFVDSVSESLAEAAATPQAAPWYRAVYADDVPVGFVMLSWNARPAPGVLGPYYLWRLLVDRRHQRRGYGGAALRLVVDLVRADGAAELLTSYQPGVGEPLPFYERFGFAPTGEVDDGEVVLRLDLRR
ncbi:GNAT family N-acetyltransferase [Actinosynnema sp. NPDC050436]|uniref:GNAT family N-acetyltransferase n=1 Tax=Actinosynnema sp. NPDC050436 TaxID=3155659 RepID=UPI0033F31E2C